MEQPKYKNHRQDTDKVLKTIHSKNGEWVPVNLKVIQDITGVNNAYASFVFQSIKQDRSLESKIVYTGNSQKKNLEFRLKVVQPAQIPSAMTTKHKKYSNITEHEANVMMAAFNSQKMAIQSYEVLFQVANVLASHGGTEGYVEGFVTKVGDLLIMRHAQVRLYTDLLVKAGLVHVDNNRAMLTFGNPVAPPSVEETVQKELEAGTKQAATAQAEPAAAAPVKKPEQIVAELLDPVKETETLPVKQYEEKPDLTLVKSDPVVIDVYENKRGGSKPSKEAAPVQEIQSPNDPSLQQQMIDGMSGFGRIIGDFQSYMGDLAKQISSVVGVKQEDFDKLQAELEATNSLNKDLSSLNQRLVVDNENYRGQLVEKDTQLKSGNKVLNDLMAENAATKQALKDKNEELRRQKGFTQCQVEVNNRVFETLQERLQIAIADINTTVVDFTRIPAWQIKPADTARVQTQILNAITSAISDIVKSNSTESKYAKDA